MSTTYISAALRREVIERADGCCEYCAFDSKYYGIQFAIDHIISEKHGGKTNSDNLCLSCYWCNSYKGSDISSVEWLEEAIIVPLYNPRIHTWSDHFKLDDEKLIGITSTGRVTISLLRMNTDERLEERQLLIDAGVYPCSNDVK